MFEDELKEIKTMDELFEMIMQGISQLGDSIIYENSSDVPADTLKLEQELNMVKAKYEELKC